MVFRKGVYKTKNGLTAEVVKNDLKGPYPLLVVINNTEHTDITWRYEHNGTPQDGISKEFELIATEQAKSCIKS